MGNPVLPNPPALDPNSYEGKMANFQKDYDALIAKSGHLTPIPVEDQPNPTPDPKALNDYTQKTIDTMDQWSKDPSFFGKEVSAPIGDYNRFAQSSQFKKLGYDPYTNNEDIYHQNQGTLSRLGNSGSQLIGKTAAYTVQTAGFLLGAPAALLSNDITKMTDNFLVKASDVIKDFSQDHNPIYKSDQYTKGSIWDKLASTDWWLDDAVDRLALTASMFVPGVLEAKGIGLAGLGTKALKAVAANPESYGQIAKTFLPKLYEAAGTGTVDIAANPALKAYAQSLTRAELYGWNIVGQSALNAKETQAGVIKTLKEQREKGENNLSDEDINTKAAQGAKASFWETVPITLASSMWEIPQMFSTTQGAKSVLDKLYNSSTGEALLNNLKSSAPGIGKIALTAALTGFEHGQNESMQVAISRYNEDSQTGKDPRGTIPGIWGDFLDNVNDPNGQNNIALGTIQGILMTVGGKSIDKLTGKYKDEFQQKQSTLDIINSSRLARRFYTGDLIQKGPDGPIIDSKGNPVKDQDKITSAGLSLAGITQQIELKKKAIEDGDYLYAHKIDHDNLSGFAYNFLSDPSGLNHLNGILSIEKEAAKLNPDFKAYDAQGHPITAEQLYLQHLSTIKTLKQVYDGIDQRHAGFTDLNIDPKNKLEVSQARPFLEAQRFAQYHEASNQIFLNNSIQSVKSNLSSLATKIMKPGLTDQLDKNGNPVYQPIPHPSSLEEQQYNAALENKEPLDTALQISKNRYKKLIDKIEIRKAFKDHVKFLEPIVTAAQKQQEEKIAKEKAAQTPRTESAPVTLQPEIIQPEVSNEVIDPLKNPDTREKLTQGMIEENKTREANQEPIFHSIEDFAHNSPAGRDILNHSKLPPLHSSQIDPNEMPPELYDFDPNEKTISPQFLGKIVFISAGTGKSKLSETHPEVVDGDQLMLEFLQEKGISHSTSQKSGLDFHNYLTKHPKDASDLIADFQNKAQAAVKDNQHVLVTASKYLRPIANKIYLSQDVKRLTKVFEERGDTAPARSAAKHIKENREEFQGRKNITNIEEGTFAEHILTDTIPEVAPVEVSPSLQEKIAKINDLDALKDLETSLLPEVSMGKISPEELDKAIKDKRKQLITEVSFNNIQKDDILVMKDKKFWGPKALAQVVSKTEDEIIVRKWYSGIKVGSEGKRLSLEDIQKQVELVYKQGATEADYTPVITKEDEAIAQQNQETLDQNALKQELDNKAPDQLQQEGDDLLNTKEDC